MVENSATTACSQRGAAVDRAVFTQPDVSAVLLGMLLFGGTPKAASPTGGARAKRTVSVVLFVLFTPSPTAICCCLGCLSYFKLRHMLCLGRKARKNGSKTDLCKPAHILRVGCQVEHRFHSVVAFTGDCAIGCSEQGLRASESSSASVRYAPSRMVING